MNYPVPKIYQVADGSKNTPLAPVYVLRDGFFCRTIDHPLGWSDCPDYELGPDGKVYRTPHNPEGQGVKPDFEFGGDGRLYRYTETASGPSYQPVYELRD